MNAFKGVIYLDLEHKVGILTLSPQITTKVSHANSLDPDKTPSKSGSKPFDTQTPFSPTLSDFEAL